MRTIRRLAALLALGALLGCTSPEPVSPPVPATPAADEDTFAARQARLQAYQDAIGRDPQALYRAAVAADETDGIDEYEAWVLATAYLTAFVDGPASIIEIKRTPTEWVAENFLGAAQRPGPTIRVRQDDGTIRRQGALQVVRPLDFREFVRN